MGKKREFGTKVADSTEERITGPSDANELLLCSRKRSKQENPSTKLPINDPENKSVEPKEVETDVTCCKGQENAGSSGKRKHSRWDVSSYAGEQDIDDGVSMTKRRKTRWADNDSQIKLLGPLHLPDFKGSANTAKDPELQKLGKKLLDINCKLTHLNSIDKLPMEASPCQKLIKMKQQIIRELVQKTSTFDGPSDLKPQKFSKKLYIPVQEYPEYNFIGLILGPRGRTKDKMEMDTGAKIMLRGKGASKLKEGKQHPSDAEDLHVLVEATAQSSVDAAVAMVEKLLVPVEDGRNELKRSQLRELAILNHTLKGENTLRTGKMTSTADDTCEICGDLRHYTVACPLRAPLPEIKVDEPLLVIKADKGYHLCETCGDPGHLAVACPFYGTLLQAKRNSVTVLPALGDGFSQSTKPLPGHQPLEFRPGVSTVPFVGDKSNSVVDPTSLYVAHFPQYVDVGRLIQLFSPFGALSQVKVIRDEGTGLSRGYGYVKYIDPTSAALAMNQMNGYRLDGNTLVVQVAGHQHGTPGNMQPVEHASFCFQPAYLSSSATSHITAPTCWSGPPGSVLPETYNQMYVSYGSSYAIPVPSSRTSTLNPTSEELAQFPGNPDNFASGYHSRTSTLNTTSAELTQFPGNPDMFASGYHSRTSTLTTTSAELAQFPGNPDKLASGYRSLFS